MISRESWEQLSRTVESWWDGDLRTAQEPDVRADEAGTLLFLPFPYSSAGGSETVFPEMYGWDTYFINRGMLRHGRGDLVRQHILNHLSLIERFGMVLNGNRSYYLTRSQTPLLPDSLWHYAQAHDDPELLMRAYPALVEEYRGYWRAEHHLTPVGLSTARDLGDPSLRIELASEAETGLDFSPLFAGDVRDYAPLIINCALVRYSEVLAWLADTLGRGSEAAQWREQARQRAALIREYCWDDSLGFFFDYDYVRRQRSPVWSLCAYWTMWAGIANSEQAQRLVDNLAKFEHPYGLAFTDEAHASPHPEFEHLQWQYPAGWPPMHIIVIDGLLEYGYHRKAARVAHAFLGAVIGQYQATGKLWEKYNVVTGGADVPVERYATPAHHGWSSAAVVLLGEVALDLPPVAEAEASADG